MKTRIKDLKRESLFTKKDIPFPNENQVWVRGHYDRSLKKYLCIRYSDMNDFCYMDGTRIVYDGFTF